MKPAFTLMGLLMGVGLLLRVWGLDFGLPNESRPDEIPILQSVTEHILTPLMTRGDLRLNPGFYAYPSLFLYLMTLVSLCFYGIGSLLGWFHGWQSYLMVYFTDATPMFLLQRGLSVLAGTLTIPAMYGLGKQLAPPAMKESVAWLCAILTTTSYLLIRNSHFGTVDALFLLGVTLSLYFLLKFHESRETSALDQACLWIGLTLGSKYPGALLILPLLVTLGLHTLSKRFADVKHWGIQSLKALGFIAIVFCITSPWLVLTPQNSFHFFQAWGSFHYLPNAYAQPNTVTGWIFYPSLAFPFGYGSFLCLFSLFGLWWIWRHRQHKAFWILLSYGIPACLILGPNVHVMTRYAMLPAPMLLFSAACGIHVMSNWVSQLLKAKGLRRSQVTACIVAFCLFSPLSNALRFNQLLAQPDTRTLARNWILQHVPPNSAVATGPSSGRIVLPRSYGQLLLLSGASNSEPPRDIKTEPMDAQNLVINTYGNLEVLKRLHIQYVVLYLGLPVSSNAPWELETFQKNALLEAHWSPLEAQAPNPIFDPIDAFFVPFHHFQGFRQPGPEIFIFRIP